jgi:hypothetical protein
MVLTFATGNFRFTYSTHLGVMCHPFTRCVAASSCPLSKRWAEPQLFFASGDTKPPAEPYLLVLFLRFKSP